MLKSEEKSVSFKDMHVILQTHWTMHIKQT